MRPLLYSQVPQTVDSFLSVDYHRFGKRFVLRLDYRTLTLVFGVLLEECRVNFE